jgi:hypothetical protein
MPRLWRSTLLALVWLVPFGVLIQAATAAPTILFIRGSVALHGALSFLVLGCALGAAIFTWALRLGWGPLVLTSASVILLTAQTVLGYATRAPGDADREAVAVADRLAVVHVSLGMFLLVFTIAVGFKVSREVRFQWLASAWAEGELDDR